MNFKSISNGMVDGFCLITAATVKTTAKGMQYLDLTLSDDSGEINGKLWDYSEMTHGVYAAGDIIKVRGTVTVFNNVDQLRIERIRKAVPADEADPSQFVKSAEYTGEDMLAEIERTVENMADSDLKTLTSAIIADHREQLLYWPAAAKLHHAMRGGLLYHTLSMLRLAQSTAAVYPFVDADLLFAGVILHDIAKIYEFDLSSAGTVKSYSTEGMLIGHLVKGAMIVGQYAEKLGTDPKKAMLIEHMIISHHGEPEHGAAVRPAFIEAEILSRIDSMDACIYEMAEAVFAAGDENFSDKLWFLDGRKCYNHGLGGSEMKAQLF